MVDMQKFTFLEKYGVFSRMRCDYLLGESSESKYGKFNLSNWNRVISVLESITTGGWIYLKDRRSGDYFHVRELEGSFVLEIEYFDRYHFHSKRFERSEILNLTPQILDRYKSDPEAEGFEKINY